MWSSPTSGCSLQRSAPRLRSKQEFLFAWRLLATSSRPTGASRWVEILMSRCSLRIGTKPCCSLAASLHSTKPYSQTSAISIPAGSVPNQTVATNSSSLTGPPCLASLSTKKSRNRPHRAWSRSWAAPAPAARRVSFLPRAFAAPSCLHSARLLAPNSPTPSVLRARSG